MDPKMIYDLLPLCLSLLSCNLCHHILRGSFPYKALLFYPTFTLSIICQCSDTSVLLPMSIQHKILVVLIRLGEQSNLLIDARNHSLSVADHEVADPYESARRPYHAYEVQIGF
jgi:hypothetical protein